MNTHLVASASSSIAGVKSDKRMKFRFEGNCKFLNTWKCIVF